MFENKSKIEKNKSNLTRVRLYIFSDSLCDGKISKGDNVKQLEEVRQEIDEIDAQLAKLFEKRMQAANEVAQYKMENDMPVFDPVREKVVIQKSKEQIHDESLKEDYGAWIQKLMDISKKRQRQMMSANTVAYCGIEGAFAHSVTTRLFPDADQKACKSFDEVFEAVCANEAVYGVLPLENSNSGLVGEVMDGLLNYPIYIHQVVDERIEQCLLGTKEATLSDIKWVYSKDQALWQSKDFLDRLHVETIAYPNTALAAQYVAQQNDKTKAAIGSKENASLYGLNILAENIELDSSNTTRFLVISTKENEQLGDYCSLLISVNNTVGSLAKAINVISAFGLDMDCLQSRPRKGHPFEYFFYIQADGKTNRENLEACLQALRPVCLINKWLGSYAIQRKED